MPVVVDASAVAAMAFGEEEGATVASHIAGEALLAPEMLDLELANVALKKIRRHPERTLELSICLQRALSLRIARCAVPADEVFALAMRFGLTAYDASYLWLARAHDAELVTLDNPLARVAPA